MEKTSVTNQQRAYEYVRGQIINLRFKPGEWVTDTQIANVLSVSRTPVREAFYRLEKEGLLVNEARRGWRVYSLSLENINHIFDIKEVVEGMIARKATLCKDEDLRAALQDALERMDTAAQAHDADAWLEADICLHDTLFLMAGNERAREIIANLNAQWHRVRIGFAALQGRTERSSTEHRAIVQSVLSGDEEGAEQQMRSHLNLVREELVHLLRKMVMPFVEEGV